MRLILVGSLGNQDPREDEQLIEQYKNGSEHCFEILYARYVGRIYGYMYHMLGQRESAQDLTQDIFLRFFEKPWQYRPIGKFSSWLYRVARNRALSFIQRHKELRYGTSLDVGPSATENIEAMEFMMTDERLKPDQVMVSNEIKELVRAGLLKLKPEDREALVLCDIDEMPQKEAAEIMGCSRGSLANRLWRARQRLLKVIGIKRGYLSRR